MAHSSNRAYATLLTRSSYLAGVIILAYTLQKHKSAYPLVVLYTDSLPQPSIRALELEATKLHLVLKNIPALQPNGNVKVHLIAERFGDTWTKLRVFELFDYDTVCFLDADMIVRKNMDSIFDVRLPGKDWISANHACVCNLDNDAWAPEEWNKDNCAYTPLHHPKALTHPIQPSPNSRPTYHLLNSGMFLFHPSAQLWARMLQFFNTTPQLSSFKFPDQDFLAEFFRTRWKSVGWQYNALKTMRYWHGNVWRDEEVVCLHYIVDKPWARRVGEDGVAGYLGRDGETHRWWWQEYQHWQERREREGGEEVLGIVGNHVAKPEGEEGEESEDMKAIGSQVQAFAKNKPEVAEGADDEGEVHPPEAGHAVNGELPQPQLGEGNFDFRRLVEKGHGPVANGRIPRVVGSIMPPKSS